MDRNSLGQFLQKVQPNELIGQRFGRLVVKEWAGKNKNKMHLYKCICDCGNITIVGRSALLHGQTKSCGCLGKELASARMKKQFTKHGMNTTAEYRSWAHMIQRCNNPKNDRYNSYGGEGIKICKQWREFTNFYNDMGDRPKNTSLDRWPDKYGDYTPSNCRWATPTQQSQNVRKSKANKTGTTGISLHKNSKKYRARITVNYKEHCLGVFDKIENAIEARKQAESKYWGAPCL